MTLEKISVLVPVYGEDEYLDQCIESIVNQTYDNLEIILVDDGSPDLCPIICDKWAKKDNRIRVIHKENGGLVSARQEGMRAATGGYIGYVDGDDWIEPERYERMMQLMISHEADIVITGFKKELYGKNIEYYNRIPEGVYEREELEKDIFPKMMCNLDNHEIGLYTYVWNKLFKKQIVCYNQMNVAKDIVIGEDSACVYPSLLQAKKIVISSDTDYHYRQRMNSLLRTVVKKNDNINRLKNFYLYFKSLFEYSEYRDMILPQLSAYYKNHLIMMSDNLVLQYPKLGETFPFQSMKKDSNIIIYSAGAYGLHVYQQFQLCASYNIIAWVDPDYEQYEQSEIEMLSLEQAVHKDFDYIVIASVEPQFIDDSIALFRKTNIPKEKIVSLNENYDKAVEKLEAISELW